MARLQVEVVTPEKRLAKAEADEVIAPGADGLFGVRPGHTPYLAVLEPGLLTLQTGTTAEKYFVGGGFCEVGDDQVRVLADIAEPLAGIDLEKARKRLSEAETKLAELSPSVPAHEMQQKVVRREQVRVKLAEAR